jgi:hypothetical protein
VWIRKRDIPHFDDAGVSLRLDGHSRIGHRRDRPHHVLDALRARLRARHEDHHEHGHHHGEQDLEDVHEEGGEIPDRHIAAIDQMTTEPKHRHGGQIHDA